jgi:hypothetical protein
MGGGEVLVINGMLTTCQGALGTLKIVVVAYSYARA